MKTHSRKIATCLAIAFGVFAATHAQTSKPQGNPPMAAPAHVSNTFHFEIHAPVAQAAPFFGPEGERAWAGKHWNPVFLYPQPAKDTQGAVFTVQHGPHNSVWVNTILDLINGRMQYITFIPGVVVSVIDVRLTPSGPSSTSAEVTYTRTALDPAMNEEIEAMGNNDRDSGPDWQRSIEAALEQQRSKTP